MSPDIATITTQKTYHSAPFGEENIYYPDEDESIMPEGIVHFMLSVRLASALLAFFSEKTHVKIFGNAMFYYEKGSVEKVVSPAIMVCFGLKEMPRRVYKLWETKVVPAVVIEFASKNTWFNDVSSNVALYQKLGVKEYFIFDPEYSYLPKPLIAFRLIDEILVEQKIESSRTLSESLGLELVDTGETLRLFDPKTNEFLMTAEEMAAEIKRLKEQK